MRSSTSMERHCCDMTPRPWWRDWRSRPPEKLDRAFNLSPVAFVAIGLWFLLASALAALAPAGAVTFLLASGVGLIVGGVLNARGGRRDS